MYSNVLKFTILFVGVLVNSQTTTPESVDIPYQFQYMKLKSYLFKDGKFTYSYEHLNTKIQVALSAWKPGDSIPSGNYYLYLVSKYSYRDGKNLILKLGEIEYNCTDNKKWVRIPTLNWVNIPIDLLYEFSIMLKGVDTDLSDRKYLLNSLAKNWKYNIFFKTKDASLEGIRENENDIENPTIEFCSGNITTVGPNKILAARCSYDPDVEKRMDQCLNWRRTDQVGSDCREIMSLELKEKSIDSFCAKDPWLADCKCINRRYYKEYQKEKLTENLPDYCWYFHCASGAYLTKVKGERVRCVNTGRYPSDQTDY